MALVLAVCGCLCAGGFLLDGSGSEPIAEEPWVVPDDGWTAPTTRAPIPERASPEPPTPSKQPVTRPTSGPAPVTVVYQVTGSGEADIAYFDAESDLIHIDSAKLPWRTTIRTNGQSRVRLEADWLDVEYHGLLECTVTVTGTDTPVVLKERSYGSIWCAPE
ncbi:MmpS family transport accessory protein [Micromonospora zamorensis]|uniref:MmpS family transport accessory protein n=1 Tax=Micromonospora zamorensis TaxID=709883 RepID=UPI0033D13075